MSAKTPLVREPLKRTEVQPQAGLEQAGPGRDSGSERAQASPAVRVAAPALPDKADQAADNNRDAVGDPAGLGRAQLFTATAPSSASHSRSQTDVPGIVVARPSLKMSDMSSTDGQVGSRASPSVSQAASASVSVSVPASTSAPASKRPRPLRIDAGVPFPFPAAATPTRTRYSDHVFSGLRSAPSPPGTARWGPSFSLTPTTCRSHFDSFSSVVEIPRFRKRELNLGIVRGTAQGAAWFLLWATWVSNGLLTAFFDANIMFMLAQCAMHPPTSSAAMWVFLAVAYAVCWAISVLGVWLAYGVGFQFYRRWRRVRPAIEPIYLSLYANLHLSLLSFDHFCFLLHIRLSAWHTPHALDLVPETCHFVVQLLPGLVPMAARAGIASVLLISNWDGAGGGAGKLDPRFFDAGLTPYARAVILASCAYVGMRIMAVALAALTLLLFLARPLRTTHSHEALLGRRDPAAVHFPATTWRDENELQWAWRARTRARIQDAFELCIVRPARSSVTLEKASVPPPAKAHRRGDSAPRVLSLDFAWRDDGGGHNANGGHTPLTSPLPVVGAAEGRRRKKESTAPLTFASSFGSGMMADGFYGDVLELDAYELSPTTLLKEIQASAGLARVPEETDSRSSSAQQTKASRVRASTAPSDDVPRTSRSLVSLPITSPLTPTFVPMHAPAFVPMPPSPSSPHPLDAASAPEQTYTSSKGQVSFEVWRGRQPSSRHVSFGSRLSGFSGDATHGTVDMSDPLIDDSFEELVSWSADAHAEPSEVAERAPRGSAFFGDAPRSGSRESLASTAVLDTSISTLLDASGFAPDTSADTSGSSLHRARMSTTFGLDVLHPVHAEHHPAEPPGPSPSMAPLKTHLEPCTPPRKTSRLEPASVSSPQDSSGHDTINEADLFYQRKRRGSTAAVGLRGPGIPMASEFGALPTSPPRSPLLPVALGSPLGSSLLTLGGDLLPSPIAMKEVHDFDFEPGEGDDESTLKARGRSPSRRISFTSDADPWFGNGSPRSSPSKSSTKARLSVAPPSVLELESVHAPTPRAPPAPMAPPPPASTPVLTGPPPPPAEHELPSGSLRKRRVPVPQLHLPPPPSAFPPPPPAPTSGDIPPPLPSSFSRGYRTRIARGVLPQWHDGKTE